MNTTGAVEVLHPGLFTSIQDGGRRGYRKWGVPVSGPMDSRSAALANALLNNSVEMPLMEITLVGPTLRFVTASVVAITGADLSPLRNGAPVALNQAIVLQANDLISFGKLRFGARAYLAVKGGFFSPKVMGSSAYFQPVTGESRLTKGALIPILMSEDRPGSTSATSVKADHEIFFSSTIECKIGPEFYSLSQTHQREIFTTFFKVSTESNRMGYRLDQSNLHYPDGFSMLTSPVLPGTVQLTPSGQLIVLMRDAQTTGGYPRVLQLTETGISQLAQKKPGDCFTFTLGSMTKQYKVR